MNKQTTPAEIELVQQRFAKFAVIELNSQFEAGQSGSEIGQTTEKIEGLLSAGTAGLVHAGYPYDPYE
jgi:hypothetical protein